MLTMWYRLSAPVKPEAYPPMTRPEVPPRSSTILLSEVDPARLLSALPPMTCEVAPSFWTTVLLLLRADWSAKE